jgi:nicotinic acid phosphoribosyltransferase
LEKFEKELDQINIKHIILKIRRGDRSDESIISLLRKFGKRAESVELYGPDDYKFYRGTLLE